jgi:hypothetical protein
MAVKLLPREPTGLGLVTCFQARPFHRSIRASSTVLVPTFPAAQAPESPTVVTAFKAPPSRPPGFGLVTTFHARPFHRSISGLIGGPK